jgi:hypothetical protein
MRFSAPCNIFTIRAISVLSPGVVLLLAWPAPATCNDALHRVAPMAAGGRAAAVPLPNHHETYR